jgi:hypothetical protein
MYSPIISPRSLLEIILRFEIVDFSLLPLVLPILRFSSHCSQKLRLLYIEEDHSQIDDNLYIIIVDSWGADKATIKAAMTARKVAGT